VKKKKKTVDDIQKLIHSFPLYSTPTKEIICHHLLVSSVLVSWNFNHGKYPILQTKSGSLSPNLTCLDEMWLLEGLTQEGEVTSVGVGFTLVKSRKKVTNILKEI
jgi:hypothetical protein